VLAGRVRFLAPVTAVLLVVPLVWSVQRDISLVKTDTRVVAHDWIETHLPAGTKIATESSTAPLAGFDVVPLQLPGPAFRFDPNRDVRRLEREGVRYVLINGLVADRVLAARSSYPKESRFYADLASHAQRTYYIRPGGDLSGPWLALYKI
jgi:hypothetical protein